MLNRESIVRSVFLAIVLALGLGTAWAVAVMWSVTMLDQLTRSSRVYENLVVRIDVCVDCGATFPEPEPKGIEVFA